jgi:hypothetical protein
VDPYLQLFFKKDALALVDLLHEKDREIESWKNANDRAMELYDKRNLDYWSLYHRVEEAIKNGCCEYFGTCSDDDPQKGDYCPRNKT